MGREQIKALWSDRANWKWGIIYACSQDPRVIVPRRWRWGGWTLNFAHPRAGLTGLGALALAVAPGLLTLWIFNRPDATLIVMFFSILGLITWAHLESSRTE